MILSNVEMYKSVSEDDNVAFDIIRPYQSRDYFRIGYLGIYFLRETHSTLTISGVDEI